MEIDIHEIAGHIKLEKGNLTSISKEATEEYLQICEKVDNILEDVDEYFNQYNSLSTKYLKF